MKPENKPRHDNPATRFLSDLRGGFTAVLLSRSAAPRGGVRALRRWPKNEKSS